jgi:hypothetical protein
MGFLQGGGDLVAIGAPAFSTLTASIDGQWMDKAAYLERLARTRPTRVVFDFDDALPAHTRGTDRVDRPCEVEAAKPGADGSAGTLHVRIADLQGWDTMVMEAPQGAFPEGSTLTCFWAKGGARTTQLALEWRERDGSRWIAVVPLTPGWKPYALRPSDFRYWQDSSSQGRGRPGDVFRPESAAGFSVGLAMTHTAVPGGAHEYWIDQIGTAPDPFADLPAFSVAEPPVIDTLSPAYKLYPNGNAASLDDAAGRAILNGFSLPMPGTVWSCHPRPQGTGFAKARKWRWVPLVQTRGADGEVSGTLATLTINEAAPLTGSLVACITAGDDSYAGRPDVVPTVTQLIARMLRGVFLYEGGAQYYAYFDGEAVRLGARVANYGRAAAPELTVELAVTDGDGQEVFSRRLPVAAEPGQTVPVEATWERGETPGDEYRVVTRLLGGETVLDSLEHPLLIWRPKATPQYVTTRDGDFHQGQRKWFPHGTNYMPSSECGIEDGEYFEYWLDSQPYDPVVTERDLARIAAAGMNMVSVFVYHRSIESRNLLDLLARCERHGLKANLSLRPGTPLDFQWPQMGEIITRYRLAEMDNLFAYDLAWEPVFGGYEARRRWDPQWAEWVIERYGSIESAEKDWGVPISRAGGVPTGPSDQQVSTDGEWRVMVAAYRRFVDDLLSRAHLEAAQKIRSVDPHHLLSFRMNVAGDPTAGAAAMAYDFAALAKSVDIMEPEGYGRIGDLERVLPGAFTAAYARLGAPTRPVMWAEFGNNVWDQARMTQDEGRLAFTAQFYRDFLTVAHHSQANGTVSWFYPGGYRWNERSDFGLINPDGTWREVTRVIHELAPQMTTERPEPGPIVEFRVDRDADARGMQGIWARIGADFLAAVREGRHPVLVSDGHGQTSAARPVVAVGNRPYDGSNPPKYLNAEFNRLEVLGARGQWVAVERDGQEVAVRPGQPVRLRASVGNIGWATWLAADGPGRAYLATTEGSAAAVRVPIPAEVPRLGNADLPEFEVPSPGAGNAQLIFEMLADERARFGEKRSVVLVAEP